MEVEKWKTIEGYPGYQVSNLGRVKSMEHKINCKNGSIRTIRERILKPNKNTNGYFQVCLCRYGIRKYFLIHRLVCSAFVQNESLFYNEINHIDECKTNNCASNLEWTDRKSNCNFGTRNKRISKAKKGILNTKKSKPVMCIETNQIYPSTMEVSRRLGFSQCNIWSCCKGKRNTCGGYHWRYVD